MPLSPAPPPPRQGAPWRFGRPRFPPPRRSRPWPPQPGAAPGCPGRLRPPAGDPGSGAASADHGARGAAARPGTPRPAPPGPPPLRHARPPRTPPAPRHVAPPPLPPRPPDARAPRPRPGRPGPLGRRRPRAAPPALARVGEPRQRLLLRPARRRQVLAGAFQAGDHLEHPVRDHRRGPLLRRSSTRSLRKRTSVRTSSR